jgi:hypothetical protein
VFINKVLQGFTVKPSRFKYLSPLPPPYYVPINCQGPFWDIDQSIVAYQIRGEIARKAR